MSELVPSSPLQDESQPKRKVKRRNLGNFPCPDCGKIFTRTDHLSRHYLNHKPKQLYRCDFMVDTLGGGKRPCGKTFVRKDLKERHEKRHLSNSPNARVNWSGMPTETPEYKDSPESIKSYILTNSNPSSPRTVDNQSNINITTNNHHHPHLQHHQMRSHSIPGDSPLQISNLINNAEPPLTIFNRHSYDSKSKPSPLNPQMELPEPPPGLKPMIEHISNGGRHKQSNSMDNSNAINNNPNNNNFNNTNNDIFQSQTDILSWLFTESSPINKGLIPTPSIVNSPNIDPSNNLDFRYELADTNIFQHESNPLDEILLRNYNQLANQFQQQPVSQSPNGLAPLNGESQNYQQQQTRQNHEQVLTQHQSPRGGPNFDDRMLPFNFSLPSSISINSPTSTNESNTTPQSINDLFSPNINQQQRKLHEYGTKYNIVTNKHIYIDKIILDKIFKCLTSITKNKIDSIFNDKVLIEDRFSYYLSIYWLVFHPQFNFLHKASFRTSAVEPLLLISMVLIGCNYCISADNPLNLSSPRSKSPEYKLSLSIAVPLRYAIFEHEDFKSPVKLWVLQSLALLEWSEKNFLSRRMHERAHIHHASTVQLMRRSPVFGGNPVKSSTTNNNNGNSEAENDSDNIVDNNKKNDIELFNKWVESESMKRITFMTYYLDISDYVKFRHNPVILFHQLQIMKLPCNDELWEATDTNESFIKILKRQKKLQDKANNNNISNERFLNVLKRLLNNTQIYPIKISPFVKKILYGGLLSIMYQMQQLEVENSTSLISMTSSNIPNSNGANNNNNNNNNSHHHNNNGTTNSKANFQMWKELLTTAIDNFSKLVKENCTEIELNKDSKKFIDCTVSNCKFPLYHITQIVAMPDLNTYDMSIYCGSPANQNVDISLKDRLVVERKLSSIWLKHHQSNINDIVNLKGIVHCYIFLWETLLSPNSPLSPPNSSNTNGTNSSNGEIKWHPDKDYFDAIFGISLAMQTLWSYCYLTSNVESNRYKEIESQIQELNYDKLIDLSVETGHEYLSRIKQEFQFNLRRYNFHNSHNIENLYDINNKINPHDIVVKYCEILPKISNKQNISGLCFLVGTKLYNSQWEPVRENGKLIINCGFRSIGKKEVLCADLFDVELLD